MTSYTIQPMRDDDLDTWVALRNTISIEPPTTADATRHSFITFPRQHRFLAWAGTTAVGGALGFYAPTIADSSSWFLTLGVLPEHRRSGLGSDLLARLETALREDGADYLCVDVRSTQTGDLAFWRSHGFDLLERHPYVQLELASARPPSLPQLPDGLRLVALADALESEPLSQALYTAFCEAYVDEPSERGQTAPEPYEQWMAMFEHPAYDDHGLVLVDGAGAVAAFLLLSASTTEPGLAYHSYTGVTRVWRGHGLAQWLKIRVIDLARDVGLERLKTSNQEHNVAMRHINAKLGYEHAYDELLLRRPVR